MLKRFRIRLAERRYYLAVGECIAYNRLPLHVWDVHVATALRQRRDAFKAQLCLALVA